MSGVGKTYLSSLLRAHSWFHYSGDYRIGSSYKYIELIFTWKIGNHGNIFRDFLPVFIGFQLNWVDTFAKMLAQLWLTAECLVYKLDVFIFGYSLSSL